MNDILCKFFGFIKYLLLILAFGLVFYGIMKTYARLEKPLSEAIDIFVPFVLVFLIFIVNLFFRNKHISNNLFFNFVCVAVFSVIIIICVRAMFDTNMLLFHKYGIDYNPSFLSDNLSAVKMMLYMIFGADLILLICGILDRNKAIKK